jgi:hypothetical protein
MKARELLDRIAVKGFSDLLEFWKEHHNHMPLSLAHVCWSTLESVAETRDQLDYVLALEKVHNLVVHTIIWPNPELRGILKALDGVLHDLLDIEAGRVEDGEVEIQIFKISGPNPDN